MIKNINIIINEELQNIFEYGEANLPAYNYNFENLSDFEVQYNFETEDGDDYIVIVKNVDRIKRIWDIQFGIAGETPQTVVNKGRIGNVMATIVKITNDFIDKSKPNILKFEPSKNSDNDMRRYNMYMAYIKQHMRLDYFVYEYKPYIIIERKVKIVDKNIVSI